LVSTAASGLFLALSAINQFHAALEQPFAFFVGKLIGNSARFLGETGTERYGFGGCFAFLHADSLEAKRFIGQERELRQAPLARIHD